MSGQLIHEPQHEHDNDKVHKGPDTGPGGKGQHGIKDMTGGGGMDKGSHLMKGHKELAEDGKPKNPTHSGSNPAKDSEDAPAASTANSDSTIHHGHGHDHHHHTHKHEAHAAADEATAAGTLPKGSADEPKGEKVADVEKGIYNFVDDKKTAPGS